MRIVSYLKLGVLALALILIGAAFLFRLMLDNE